MGDEKLQVWSSVFCGVWGLRIGSGSDAYYGVWEIRVEGTAAKSLAPA